MSSRQKPPPERKSPTRVTRPSRSRRPPRASQPRLSDAIPEELWNSKSTALQEELRQVRTEMERHEVASQAYETAGLQILELAQTAYSSYVTKNPHEQARLIKTLVSNSTFDRGSLSPTSVKPFDVFAKGSETWPFARRRKPAFFSTASPGFHLQSYGT